MAWNYRLLNTGDQFTIHEVYYDEENNNNITGYSDRPAYPRGDTLEQLLDDIQRYLKALERPVLHEKGGYLSEALDKE